jgi:hypothetical protein
VPEKSNRHHQNLFPSIYFIIILPYTWTV